MSITYTIPGARTLDQLNEPTLDKLPDENARENCVAASAAEGLDILTHKTTYTGDQLKDAVYGESYTGPTSAARYVTYCYKQGVNVTPHTGDQGDLIATIRGEVADGHPVIVTMPSNWGTAPADPVHPSGYTHVGLAVGVGPGTIRVMNPWHGFMQDASDAWWQARLCYGQVWIMTAIPVTPSPSPTKGVPAGWTDDGKTLKAPNGNVVVKGFRDYVLSFKGGWSPTNQPLSNEAERNPVIYGGSALGDGSFQVFDNSLLIWTAKTGVMSVSVGSQMLYIHNLYMQLLDAAKGVEAAVAIESKLLQ